MVWRFTAKAGVWCAALLLATTTQAQETKKVIETTGSKKTAVATFGGGCFWCTEAVFENMKGVTDVVSGYAGGKNPNPTYKQVCTGTSGHAEVCQIHYNPAESANLRLELFHTVIVSDEYSVLSKLFALANVSYFNAELNALRDGLRRHCKRAKYQHRPVCFLSNLVRPNQLLRTLS